MFLALRISRLFWKTECDQFLLHCSEFCSSSSDDLPYFQAPLGFFHLQAQTKTGGKVSPFLSKALIRSFSCLSPLALKLEMRPFEPYRLIAVWSPNLFVQTGGKVSPFLSKSLNLSFSCLSPLALKLERRPFGPCSYTLSWQRDLLYYSPHIFSRNVAHSSASPCMKTLNLT